jgi:hypothetical protein
MPGPVPPSLFLACLPGLGPGLWRALGSEAPWLAGLAGAGAELSLAAGPPSGAAWRRPGGGLWAQLSGAGLAVGLVDLPGLWPAPRVAGFAVARPPRGGRRPEGAGCHPPELARDLADHPPEPAMPRRAARLPEPQRDTLFARAAAADRLRYETARRLLLRHRPAVAAVGLHCLAAARRLWPGRGSPRPGQALAQADAYLSWLADELRPRAVLAAGWGLTGGGVVLAAGPGVEPGPGGMDWSGLLAAAARLAGLDQGRALAGGA